MDRRLLSVILALIGTVIFFGLIIIVGGIVNPNLQLDETALLRFVFVGIGLLIVFLIYWATRESPAWEVGTREVVYMGIGAALYAVLSFLFNGTVFVVPSVSQVSLRPAISIPMFFGYAFGPVVGFFTGAVGNMFGDALTGFSLSPQWSVGNGLIGLISGLPLMFRDKQRSLDTVLITGAVITAAITLFWLVNRNTVNELFFNPYGEQISPLAGLSALVGFILIVIVRFAFRDNIDIAAAVTWGMLGNFLGLGFAALSDIWINQYSPVVAFVGEFLPAAGPNLIFAAVLVPLLVAAYASVRRQTGR
jgi:uncharacterized membrane protein